MKNYMIETNWGGMGTVYYHVGKFEDYEKAKTAARKNYKGGNNYVLWR